MTDIANDCVFIRVSLKHGDKEIEHTHVLHISELERSVLGKYEAIAIHAETVVEELVKGARRESFFKGR